jgi:hypothetical protein
MVARCGIVMGTGKIGGEVTGEERGNVGGGLNFVCCDAPPAAQHPGRTLAVAPNVLARQKLRGCAHSQAYSLLRLLLPPVTSPSCRSSSLGRRKVRSAAELTWVSAL